MNDKNNENKKSWDFFIGSISALMLFGSIVGIRYLDAKTKKNNLAECLASSKVIEYKEVINPYEICNKLLNDKMLMPYKKYIEICVNDSLNINGGSKNYLRSEQDLKECLEKKSMEGIKYKGEIKENAKK